MVTPADHLAAYLADLAQHTRPNTVRASRADLPFAATYLTGSLDHLSLARLKALLVVDVCSPASHVRPVPSLRSFFA